MSHFKGEDFMQLRRALEDIPNAINGIAEKSATEIEELIQKQFEIGTDPFGAGWEPNQKGTQILVDTGFMLSTLVVMVDGKEIFMSMDEPANYHQTGTSRMVARPIFPDDTLPPAWEEVLEKNSKEILDKKLGGK